MSTSIVYEKSCMFSVMIIKLCKQLYKNKEYILSKQLLRSGTSIGANIAESISAHSKKDFLYKLTIALKEARETQYWLKILQESRFADLDYLPYFQQIETLIRLLCSSTKTIKEQLNDRNPLS